MAKLMLFIAQYVVLGEVGEYVESIYIKLKGTKIASTRPSGLEKIIGSHQILDEQMDRQTAFPNEALVIQE